jgi:DNA-binding NtrC family response regulator
MNSSLRALARTLVGRSLAPTSPPRDVILLVEDDHAVRDLVQSMLERNGYEVHSFADPRSALAYTHTRGGGFDLVLTDVVLPDMSGRVLLNRILELQPDAPVLYMSGYSRENIESHAVLPPDAWFLPKPFTSRQLLATIHRVLGDDVVGDAPAGGDAPASA